MHPRLDPSPALIRLAGEQAGVVTTEQARALGLSRHALTRLTGRGDWQRLGRDVLQVTSGPVTFEALAWGGVLLGGPRARLGAQASGFLHGLLEQPPRRVDVLVPIVRHGRPGGPWLFHRERPGARSSRSPGGPPRLTVEDTVLDLAEAGGPGAIVGLVTTAVQRRLTTHRRIALQLGERARHRHRRLITDLLVDVAEGVESPLEHRYLHEVERAHGLPRPSRQRRRTVPLRRTDVEYAEFGLIVELDGRRGHAEEPFRDLARDNDSALRALLALRYGWWDVVERPCSVAFQVGEVLIRHGWRGVPRRCGRCRATPDSLLAT